MQESIKNGFNDNLVDEVISSTRLKGELTDKVVDKSTGESKVIEQGHNMIMIGCHKLIASLVAGKLDSSLGLYFAIGGSNNALNAGDENLQDLLFKIPIKDEDVTLSEDGTVLTLSAEFPDVAPDGIEDAKYNTIWQECAIFKGDYMLNRKVHGAIEKNSDMIIRRTFKFTF